MNTLNTLQDIIKQANKLGKFSSEQNVEVVEYSDSSDNDGTYRFYIYTNENKYSIKAVTKAGGRSYLGCIASNRKPRAGEDWTRGNDLADGDLSEETWNRILADIVSYELVKVHKTKSGQKGPTIKPDTSEKAIAKDGETNECPHVPSAWTKEFVCKCGKVVDKNLLDVTRRLLE